MVHCPSKYMEPSHILVKELQQIPMRHMPPGFVFQTSRHTSLTQLGKTHTMHMAHPCILNKSEFVKLFLEKIQHDFPDKKQEPMGGGHIHQGRVSNVMAASNHTTVPACQSHRSIPRKNLHKVIGHEGWRCDKGRVLRKRHQQQHERCWGSPTKKLGNHHRSDSQHTAAAS